MTGARRQNDRGKYDRGQEEQVKLEDAKRQNDMNKKRSFFK